MSEPKVSYVVASYNHERYIGELLDSIRAQSIQEIEIVVVDDGSGDRTATIAEQAAERDGRIRVYRQENRGVVDARNRGVRASGAPFISVVDSDDLLPADRTEVLLVALEGQAEASMAWGEASIIDEHGESLGRFSRSYPALKGEFSLELFAGYCFVPAVSVMFRRSAFEATGPFWGPGPNTDYLKWIELGLMGPAIRLDGKELGCWRWHSGNVSRGSVGERAAQYGELREGLEELARRRPELAARLGEKRLARRYGRCHFMAGFYAGHEGEWKLARAEFVQAARHDRSLLHGAALVSTLPGVHWLSSFLYRRASRRRLPSGV